MFHSLRPAGDRIRFGGSADDRAGFPAGARVTFYDSGTSALAAALVRAVRASGTDKPEVLLPAYACPDLLSATIHAGARARLVDLAAERPWIDLNGLERALSDRTVAVIAVNFLGIPERLDRIRERLAGRDIALIHDCAQDFAAGCVPVEGVTAILSFGRGKPVSLLGGGAVVDAAGAPDEPSLPAPHVTRGRLPGASFHVKGRLYNTLARPRLYWLPEALPFLGLGRTRFNHLDAIGPAPPELNTYLAPNIAAHLRRPLTAQRSIASVLKELEPSGLRDLADLSGIGTDQRLLRYPVICDNRATRDHVVTTLREAGLGASTLYGATLPFIADVPLEAFAGPTRMPVAEAFAEHLLTLPTHEDVTLKDIRRMASLLRTPDIQRTDDHG